MGLILTGSHNRGGAVASTDYNFPSPIVIPEGLANSRLYIGVAAGRFYVDNQEEIKFNGVLGTLKDQTTTGPAPRVHVWEWTNPAAGSFAPYIKNTVNTNDGRWFWALFDAVTGAVISYTDESASDNNANPPAVVSAGSLAFMICSGLVASNGGSTPFVTIGESDGVTTVGVAPSRTYPSATQLAAVTLVIPAPAPPVITGPSGAAGAASITHSTLELQNGAGTWTSSAAGAWSLTGTDAALLSIAGGFVTKASGSFDFETKASYSFNVVCGSVSQAVTLNITNVVEISAPTRSTPNATTAAPGFTTDIGSGTAYCVLIAATSPPSAPSIAQVKAGSVGIACSPLTITSAGAKVFAPATVTADLTYYPFTVHTASGIDSAVLPGLPHYPGTGRPVADVSVTGWTPTGAASVAATMNEDASNRATYSTGPAVSGTPSLVVMDLDKPYPPGTYSFNVDADMLSGTGKLRLKMFDGSGTLLGTSADQTLTTTATVYTVNVTVAGGTATRIGVETQA
jgi:hypothetical protein